MPLNPDQIQKNALVLLENKPNVSDNEYIHHLEETVGHLLKVIEDFQGNHGHFSYNNSDDSQQQPQHQSAHHFETYFKTSNTLIAILDQNCCFIDANPAFINTLGYSINDLNSIVIADIVHFSEKRLFKDISSLTESIINQNNLIPFASKNNQQVWLNCFTTPFLEGSSYIFYGQLRNTDFLLTDIKKTEITNRPLNTEYLNYELKKANIRMHFINAELLKAKSKAEESDRLKSSFLANMSHEIRTPMNGIIGFANLLASENLDIEKKQHYISIINSSAGQLLTIISDIIDISKIEAGQLDIVNSSFNVNDIIEDIRVQFENEIISKNKTEVELETDTPSHGQIINSDVVRIKQIMSNLVGNAIKFTHKGFVKFGYQIEEQNLIFYVEDSGKGISKDQLEVIFERFRQEDTSNTKEYGGTGLGLSISKALVEKLGGELNVKSIKGKGTSFYFNIPIKKKQQPENESIVKTNDIESINWQGKSILVVEDTDITRVLLNEILEPTHVEINLTDLGLEAIEICKNKLPDLVLMDIQLPDISGFEATVKIKKFAPNLPIIAQTAYAMSSDDALAKSHGCNDYIAKPYNRKKLLLLIDKYLNQSP